MSCDECGRQNHKMDCTKGRRAAFPFHYKGTVTLTNDAHAFDLHNVELWEEQAVEESYVGGEVVCTYTGLRSWHGVARVVSPPGRLLTLLDEEVGVRLADGRLGHAYVTGYAEWYAQWIIEITGVGPTPNLNNI